MKYKKGEKMIVEITEVKEDSYVLNRIGEIEPMEAKIRRQTAEITRLLAENKELKDKLDNRCDMCIERHEKEVEQARAEGAETAWELARKIICQPKNGGFNRSEITEIFGYGYISDIFERYTYPEAAAKVAEWEKATIKRGDEVEKNDLRDARFIVTFTNGKLMNGVTQSGLVFSNEKTKDWHKTGRHIDIDGFLKQIGGEE